jgi:hypothetical protein
MAAGGFYLAACWFKKDLDVYTIPYMTTHLSFTESSLLHQNKIRYEYH